MIELLKLPMVELSTTGAGRGAPDADYRPALPPPSSRADMMAQAALALHAGETAALRRTALRMHRHLTNANISRASRELVRATLAKPTGDNAQAARDLHPQEPPPHVLRTPSAAVQIDAEVLVKILKQLSVGSAAGASGWRYEHLMAAVEAEDAELDALLKFINLVLEGRLPHIPELLECVLVAFEKPSGGIRPITIAESLYRVFALSALAAVKGYGPDMAPIQMACGIPGGSQVPGHAIRTLLKNKPGMVVVSMDYANAFNSVSRQAIFDMLADPLHGHPGLVPFIAYAYARHTKLRVIGEAAFAYIWSQCGTRQGDRLGMLLFCKVLQIPLAMVAALFAMICVIAFADDVQMAGYPDDVVPAVQLLCAETAKKGLTARFRKCYVYSPTLANAQTVANQLPGMQLAEHGIVVAGMPVGTDEFVKQELRKKADKTIAKIRMLRKTPVSRQDKRTVLTRAVQHEAMHLGRIAPPHLAFEAQESVAIAVLNAIHSMVGTIFSAAQIQQLMLPISLGGFGVAMVSPVQCAGAWLAASFQALQALRNAKSEMQPFGAPQGRPWCPTIEAAWQAAQPAMEDPPKPFAPWPAAPHPQWNLHHALFKDAHQAVALAVQVQAHHDLKRQFSNDVYATARLLSCMGGVSGAWLMVLPIAPSYFIHDSDWTISFMMRAGAPFLPAGITSLTCACDRVIDNTDVDHPTACPCNANTMTKRHDRLMEACRAIGCRAGVTTTSEPMLGRWRKEHRQRVSDQRDAQHATRLSQQAARRDLQQQQQQHPDYQPGPQHPQAHALEPQQRQPDGLLLGPGPHAEPQGHDQHQRTSGQQSAGPAQHLNQQRPQQQQQPQVWRFETQPQSPAPVSQSPPQSPALSPGAIAPQPSWPQRPHAPHQPTFQLRENPPTTALEEMIRGRRRREEADRWEEGRASRALRRYFMYRELPDDGAGPSGVSACPNRAPPHATPPATTPSAHEDSQQNHAGRLDATWLQPWPDGARTSNADLPAHDRERATQVEDHTPRQGGSLAAQHPADAHQAQPRGSAAARGAGGRNIHRSRSRPRSQADASQQQPLTHHPGRAPPRRPRATTRPLPPAGGTQRAPMPRLTTAPQALSQAQSAQDRITNQLLAGARASTLLAARSLLSRAAELVEEESDALADRRPAMEQEPHLDRGDILFLTEHVLMTDVSVIAPTAATYVMHTQRPRGAAHQRDSEKRWKYSDLGRGAVSITFLPLSIETYGTIGAPFENLVRRLARAATSGADQEYQSQRFTVYALQQLSCALIQGNAQMMRSSLKRLNRSYGRAVREGLHVPTADPAYGV